MDNPGFADMLVPTVAQFDTGDLSDSEPRIRAALIQ